jgi:prophage DNA circulation protein
MSWREQMQKGSFRGVPFYTIKSDGQIGRRTVTHEYPNKNEAFVEDLGLKVRSFSLDIFVIGDNYFAERDALEAAFELAGSGELVHPWRGRMTVSVTDCRTSEGIDQGGRQGWSVTFTQTGVNTQPSVRPDTQAIVSTAADNAITAVATDFTDMFTVDKLPEFVEADALTQFKTQMDNVLAQAKSMLPDMTILPAFTANAASLLSIATQLMRLPTNLATEFTSQIGAVLGLADSPLMAFNGLLNLFGSAPQAVNRTTPSRIQQDDNRTALVALTRRTAIIEAARSSALIDFNNRTEALNTRDAVVAAIETEQLTASDEVFNTLADLRTAVVNDIDTRANDLALLITVTPQATLPATILAYRIYGDASRDAEIISRNNIAHPLFVAGGQPLQVLTDD